MLSASPVDSFFLSSEWIGAWLAVYAEVLTPQLLFFFDGDGETPVGACILVQRQRAADMFVRSIYLNCSGEDEAESTYIEYNALLALPGFEDRVSAALGSHIQKLGFDRFVVAGAAPQRALERLSASLGEVETERRPSYFVDLAQLRRHGTEYSGAISANTRKQNNFTRRQLEATFGPCVLEEASTQQQVDEYFQQLAGLHNASWQARDKPGMFSSLRFLAFHRALLAEPSSKGKALLFRLRAGEKVVAVLYCFLYRRRVYFYQSGIYYGPDKRLRPGFLALTMAIEGLLRRGGPGNEEVDEFDFLAGDSQYKKSLGTGERQLLWITVWAPSLTSGAFRKLRQLRNAGIGAGGS